VRPQNVTALFARSDNSLEQRHCISMVSQQLQVGHIAPGSSAAAATAALALYEGENSCSSTRLLLHSYTWQQQHHKAGNDAGAAQLSSVVT